MKVRIKSGGDRTPQPLASRIARSGLLGIGIVCLGIYSYSYVYRTLYQAYAGWSFDRERGSDQAQTSVSKPRKNPPVLRRASRPLVLPDVLPDPDRGGPREKDALPRTTIGRISIPRLHLAAMVEEGVDNDTLRRAVGHIPGTPLPGQIGNIGVAGHRDTFFRGLKDIRSHDEIDFSTLSGDYQYIVESLMVVEPTNVKILEPSGDNTLTMVTCFPFQYVGNAPRRFIVRARQIVAGSS